MDKRTGKKKKQEKKPKFNDTISSIKIPSVILPKQTTMPQKKTG